MYGNNGYFFVVVTRLERIVETGNFNGKNILAIVEYVKFLFGLFTWMKTRLGRSEMHGNTTQGSIIVNTILYIIDYFFPEHHGILCSFRNRKRHR